MTARSYARWAGGDEYREPMQLLPGEVPADLLARLSASARPIDPRLTPHAETAEGAELANPQPLL